MVGLQSSISTVRRSVVAILRLHQTHPAVERNGELVPPQFEHAFGSGFCVVADRYILTAYHVLNAGNPRDPSDQFVAFIVPDNQTQAHHFPVIGFPLELKDADIAVLEIGPSATPGVHVPALPITYGPAPDGSRVVTLGFPAPEVHGITIDTQGNYRGGQFFLKSHANEGIVSAQYSMGQPPLVIYELNVGWHNGESGGPVVSLENDEPVAISMMQQYRNVQTPHGVMPGPHRGVSLGSVRTALDRLGIAAR